METRTTGAITDQAREAEKPGGAAEAIPRLYNDVFFAQSQAKQTALFRTWTPFSRLPVELRIQIWLTYLRRHRMIELSIIHDGTSPGGAHSGYYTQRNHLGRLISGRRYTLKIAGGGYAATFNPLLWVNRESRHAALRLHHRIHLPFHNQQAGRVLYLNPDYDVISVSSEYNPPREYNPPAPPVTLLADFLHDVKAFDPKDQGVTHLALSVWYFESLLEGGFTSPLVPNSPEFIRNLFQPASFASFAEIVRSRLRSVFCLMGFRNNRRGMGEFRCEEYHFAQTFPLCRRGNNTTGGFRWFESDPRPGVEFDLRQVTPRDEIPRLVYAWKDLERTCGVGQRNGIDQFQLYVCPTLQWPTHSYTREPEDVSSREGLREGSREELSLHFRREAEHWDHTRKDLNFWFRCPDLEPLIPKHGKLVDAETFEMMQKTPCTAIGMWLFPAEVFKKPVSSIKNAFDLSANDLPGLFLFEL